MFEHHPTPAMRFRRGAGILVLAIAAVAALGLVIPALFRHARGLTRTGRMWVYTSVGTGFWGPPNRFLVPPELTLLELKRAS